MKTSINNFLYQTLSSILKKRGYELREVSSNSNIVKRDWKTRLQHLKSLGFSPEVIIDGGGFIGNWSKEVAKIFPDAKFIIFEPNPFVQSRLTENTISMANPPRIIQKALGAGFGKLDFHFFREPGEDYGASLCDIESIETVQTIKVDVIDLDHFALEQRIYPDFVKLDLQGGELQALNGSKTVLESTDVVMVEFGLLEAYVNRTTPRELLDFMYDNGFVLYDIVSLINRPYDQALGGGDFIFVKNNSPLRAYEGWA